MKSQFLVNKINAIYSKVLKWVSTGVIFSFWSRDYICNSIVSTNEAESTYILWRVVSSLVGCLLIRRRWYLCGGALYYDHSDQKASVHVSQPGDPSYSVMGFEAEVLKFWTSYRAFGNKGLLLQPRQKCTNVHKFQ